MTESAQRTVLITGGNRGIGLACARAFEARGHRVAITYRSKPVDDLFSLKCDVTSSDDVDSAFSAVEERWGPVEVLVANAGINKDSLLLKMNEESFQDVINTNLAGAWRVAKRATQPMIKMRWGRMIFMSSVIAYLGNAGQVNYGASKAGLIGLARSIARELGSRNVTANVVTPGAVETEMLQRLTDDQRARLTQNIALGRPCSPEDVAAAVCFLASDDASYITGAILPVDGGLAMGN